MICFAKTRTKHEMEKIAIVENRMKQVDVKLSFKALGPQVGLPQRGREQTCGTLSD